jgi:hypothetical protein
MIETVPPLFHKVPLANPFVLVGRMILVTPETVKLLLIEIFRELSIVIAPTFVIRK